MFLIEDNHVKVGKFKFKEELKFDDDYYDHLKISELSESSDV